MPDITIRHRIFESHVSACAQVAADISQLIRERATLGRHIVLGFDSGTTSLPLYEELVYLYQEEGLSFKNVIAFHLDEYFGLEAGHPASRRSFMQRHLFDHIDIPTDCIHFLQSDVCESNIEEHCKDYENQIKSVGGIDLQILGIRRNGHLGFNPTRSQRKSRTRLILLDKTTRTEASKHFQDLAVPSHALTMGCGTILDARKIILLAWGIKAPTLLRRALYGRLTARLTASYLQSHPATRVFLDTATSVALRTDANSAPKPPTRRQKKGPPLENGEPGKSS